MLLACGQIRATSSFHEMTAAVATARLYYSDTFLSACRARVLDAGVDPQRGPYIVPAQTVFHPQGEH